MYWDWLVWQQDVNCSGSKCGSKAPIKMCKKKSCRRETKATAAPSMAYSDSSRLSGSLQAAKTVAVSLSVWQSVSQSDKRKSRGCPEKFMRKSWGNHEKVKEIYERVMWKSWESQKKTRGTMTMALPFR